MRTIGSRTYTNVALTAIVVLFLVMALQSLVSVPTARAEFNWDDEDTGLERNKAQRAKAAALMPNVAEAAKATREVAQANREIAKAIKDAAKAQREIAQAILKLSDSTGEK